MENVKIKVRIKTWDEMVEKYGWFSSTAINLTKFGWHKGLEQLIPEDRIIEVESRYRSGEYHMVGYLYGISQDAIEEYLTDESGNDLTNSLHPVNSELLPELKSGGVLEQHCKDCKFHMYGSLDEPCDSCDIKTHSNFEKREVDESFNNLPNPVPQQEFKLKPLAEILEEESCKIANNNLAIFKQIQNKSHLCYYTKFQLDYDINTSIRFIHAFDDRPELVGKFIYKHHEEKLFSIIEPQLAEHFIKTQCSNEAEEFINRYVGQGKGKKYRRIKVTENSLTKYFKS